MDGGEKEKQKSLEIRAVVKVKNDSLRRSRALEAKRRRQCRLQDTAELSQINIPNGAATSSKAERLMESPIANSSPTAAPCLHSIPSSLKNQASQLSTPGPVRCEHWVNVLIDNINTLGMKKDQISDQPGQAYNFRFKANKLQNLLEEGVRSSHQNCGQLTATTPDYHIWPAEAEAHMRRIEGSAVTCLFVRAALIYLHIMIQGMDSRVLPSIQKSVFEWTFSFRFLPEPVLPDLVWPLCIVGCMATTSSEQRFFRETVISSGIDYLSSCMIWQALEIMEKSWDVHRSDGMQLGDSNWTSAVNRLRNQDVL